MTRKKVNSCVKCAATLCRKKPGETGSSSFEFVGAKVQKHGQSFIKDHLDVYLSSGTHFTRQGGWRTRKKGKRVVSSVQQLFAGRNRERVEAHTLSFLVQNCINTANHLLKTASTFPSAQVHILSGIFFLPLGP